MRQTCPSSSPADGRCPLPMPVEAHCPSVLPVEADWRTFSHSCSIGNLMVATFWRSTCTFGTFYLRDLSADTFDLCVLGPLVVDQAVVHPPV